MELFDFSKLKSFFFFGTDIGIDLGTASVLVYVKDKGIVLREPSVVAVEMATGKVLKVGIEAQSMLGRTPVGIAAIRPLKDGVISDYETTEKMLKYFLEKVNTSKIFKPRVIVCVPSGVTEVEQRAVIDATMNAGARSVHIIEEPIAAAIGSGIDINKPFGSLVIDIGGGTCDIAVVSLGGIVTSRSLKIAGDKFDDAIIKFVRRKYQMAIGERTAEEIKKKVGSVYFREEPVSCTVKGRSAVTGLPQTVTISSEETLEAFEEPASKICETLRQVLEDTPPELIGDISNRGIILTGGGSLIYGLDKLLERETGIKVTVAKDPISCVALGAGVALEQIENIGNNFKTRYQQNNNYN